MPETIELKPIPEGVVLKYGGHRSFDDGCCVMELVAYVANEPWSDNPQCTCPVISTFLRSWNDSLPNDEERTRILLPLVARVVGTRSTKEVENVRALLCVDWMIREWLPTWLDLTPALAERANELRALHPIQEWEHLGAAAKTIFAARDSAAAARDAARAAARDAARDAVWDAARAAAWDAVWDAARDAVWDAARDAVWDAVWDAARDAVWDAARDAVWDAANQKLDPIKDRLQQSAVQLIEHMIAVKSVVPSPSQPERVA